MEKKSYKVFYPFINHSYKISTTRDIKIGDMVLCNTKFGRDYLKVVSVLKDKDIKFNEIEICSPDDEKRNPYTGEKYEDELIKKANELNKKMKLEMENIDIHILDGENKCIVVYSAPKRIDFREFVKQFARITQKKILMQQIPFRFATHREKTCGVCGRPLCCATFFNNQFCPKANIKTLKEQNIVGNTNHLTGFCNRVMCCVCYEKNSSIDNDINNNDDEDNREIIDEGEID